MSYSPTAEKPGVLRDWTDETLADGSDMSLPLHDLGDYCAYLESEILLSATRGPELPLAALARPRIATSDCRLVVVPAGAIAGGRVTVASGQRLALAQEVVSATTGRYGGWITPSFDSGDLLISSTYFLRAQINAGALALYVTRGATTDSVPASLKGTPGAAAGGGFPTTALDMRLAKIVTGGAGAVPTVTTYLHDQLPSYSRSQIGFRTNEDGTIEQWGYVTMIVPDTASGYASAQIVFPVSFPNAIYSISGNPAHGTFGSGVDSTEAFELTLGFKDISLSGCYAVSMRISGVNSGNATGFSWRAIGE